MVPLIINFLKEFILKTMTNTAFFKNSKIVPEKKQESTKRFKGKEKEYLKYTTQQV